MRPANRGGEGLSPRAAAKRVKISASSLYRHMEAKQNERASEQIRRA